MKPMVNIVDGSRTPFLKAGDKPGPFLASDLAVAAARPLLLRQPFEAPDLDEVILGCVMPTADEVNIARVVSLRLGCGKTVPAYTVQRNCASGMQAIDSAAKDIQLGRANLVLAGGTEAMSHAPVLFNDQMVAWLGRWMKARSFSQKLKALSQLRPAMLAPVIGLLRGLTDHTVGLSMGQTTEIIADRFNISRERMDSFAVRSHQRLMAGIEQGHFNGEIETLFDTSGGQYTEDSGLRRDSSIESLAKLRPVFDRPYGKVTAGNSAQITDGAAWVILASDQAVQEYKLPVLGRLVDVNWAGLNPAQMGLGPVHASTPVLQRNKLSLQDIDYWEINEAFAGQVLGCLAAWESDEYCRDELGLEKSLGSIDQARLNIDGGAVSQGHPVGASGARIVLHVLNVLKRKSLKRGIATLCIGGGQGGACLLEAGENDAN
jgi:acetyl-CoA C-acetyltransferase